MDATAPIGLGVIGCGSIARACLRATQSHDSGFHLKALCGLDQDVVTRTAREFEIDYTTTRYEDVLERPDVDAVAIYSPDPLHFPMISAALRAGKNVVVTKPMVISTDEAEQVLALLEQTGRVLLVGETSRYAKYCIAARQLVDDGDLGRLVFGETHYVHDMRPVFDKTPWRYLEPKDFPIGSMCHPVALLTWYLGDAEEVFAYGVNSGVDPRYPADTPDTYLVNVRFWNGAIGRILGAFGIIHPPLPMETLSLFGTKGSLVHDRVVLDRLPGLPTATLDFGQEQGHGGEVRRYMAEFAQAVRTGAGTCSTALDAAKTVAIGEAIKESVASGQPASVRVAF
ncbi:MAG: Gfo/Idh/MocA family oxidoreductase [Chloroflexia bacterium]|nr:Gfo/Idh/MocA family oxidoreductase [Chloroflexia bacterium]